MSGEHEKIDSKKIVEQVIQNVMTQSENENEGELLFEFTKNVKSFPSRTDIFDQPSHVT